MTLVARNLNIRKGHSLQVFIACATQPAVYYLFAKTEQQQNDKDDDATL